MSGHLSVENCNAAVIEPLVPQGAKRVVETGLYSEQIGDQLIIYGKDEQFFEAIEHATRHGQIILKRLITNISATFKFK